VSAPDAPTLLIRNAAPCGGDEGSLVDIQIAGTRIVALEAAGQGELNSGAVTASRGPHAPPAAVLDAGSRSVIPGLIDLHVHGAGGADVMDGTLDAVATVSHTLARFGTTSYLGTTFLRPAQHNRHIPVLAEAVAAGLGGARLLGIHLEGPFVHPQRRGGLPADALLEPSRAGLDEVLDLAGGELKLMTIAPEVDGALAVIERLTAGGVVASFGHSDADYEQTRAGIAAGIGHVTHLYNAMRGLHHREPGPLVALYEAEDLPVQLIADDVHVDRRVVRWTRDVFGHRRCVCITDGIRTTGLPDGEHRLGGLEYSSHAGVARYRDGTLIGTSLPLLEVARRFARYTGCTLAEAVETASLHAAGALGFQGRKGSLEPGKDADLVLLDHDGSVWATVVEGEILYLRDGEAGQAAAPPTLVTRP
jgi:N-acetylglucosamine-6-phosphate deacetylase